MKPNQIRIILLVTLAFIFTILYGKWNIMYPQKDNSNTEVSKKVESENNKSTLPSVGIQKGVAPKFSSSIHNSKVEKTNSKNLINVSTNVFKLKINPINGEITNLELLK